MKKILTPSFLTAALLFSVLLNAQEERVEAMTEAPDVQTAEQSMKWKKNQHKTHTVFVYGDAKDVEKAAEKFFEDRYDADFSNEKGMNAAAGIVMSDIIAETATLAFKTEDEGEGSRLIVLVDLGGRSLGHADHPQAASSLDGVLREFAQSFYREAYAEVIDDQEKVLDDVEKEMGKLVKEGEKLVKEKEDATENIADNQEKIKELEQEIKDLEQKLQDLEKEQKKNQEAQQSQQKEVEAQKLRVNKLRQVASGMK